MTYYAWQLLRDGLSEFGDLLDGLATGGSTTTIGDTGRPSDEDPAQFEGATAIVTYDSAGAGAAPEGEWSRVTSFTSNAFNLASTLTAAVASGDHYVISSNLFPHTKHIRLMNEALRHRKLGTNVPATDTSITSANNQTEYTLPTAIKEKAIRGIFYQGITTDANDNRWIRIEHWNVTYTAGNATALLILPQLPTGRTVKIEYLGVHPAITAYNSAISEYIPSDLAVALLVERMAAAQSSESQHVARPFTIGYDRAKAELDEALRRNWPLLRPRRHPKMTIVDSGDYRFIDPDQFTYPSA